MTRTNRQSSWILRQRSAPSTAPELWIEFWSTRRKANPFRLGLRDSPLYFLQASKSAQKEPPRMKTAKCCVLFFHYHASIQQAMSRARWLLGEAKEKVPGKHALAVGYVRRSGASAVSVQPWDARDVSSADLFGLFARERGPRLSPRLAADLERDAAELASLAAVPGGHYRRELARLVRRHMQDEPDAGQAADGGHGARAAATSIAAALEWLGAHEHAPQGNGPAVPVRPRPAAQVGVFLRQEAR